MTPPTQAEVSSYCEERGNSIDPEKFIDYYAAVGWKVGRKPMKDWKAAIRLWERNSHSPHKTEYRCTITESPIIAYARERARKAKQ